MDTNLLISIIASLGVGGLLGTFLSSYLQLKNRVLEKSLDFKEKRYKAIVILMWTSLNPKSELKHIKYYREYITNSEILVRELKLELYNMLLYANDNIIRSFKIFINNISQENYSKVVIEMRKDLYERKTNIKFEDVKIEL